MQRYNYSHSEYMLVKSGYIEEVSRSYDDARFYHHADMLRYRMDELEAVGKLDDMLQMRALDALQRSQYTQSFAIVWFYMEQMDRLIEQLPVYEAPKPSKMARFFGALAA